MITDLAAQAADVDGVALVVRDVPAQDPGGLRDLAKKVRDGLRPPRRDGRSATATAAEGDLVAAATGSAVGRGVTAPAILGDRRDRDRRRRRRQGQPRERGR